jgi:hypothetical protein
MSKATVTFEDEGDEVGIRVDFGMEGGQETSGAHQMAISAVHALQREHLNNYERTARWLKACGKEPNQENLSLQIGCHIEEVYIPTHLRDDALDALCDTDVTGNGVAYMAGFDKPGADVVVLASNDAKLVDGKPVILEGGKIGKPEGWKPPNLREFV